MVRYLSVETIVVICSSVGVASMIERGNQPLIFAQKLGEDFPNKGAGDGRMSRKTGLFQIATVEIPNGGIATALK
jgi:hypothetical protein